jgi:hypothetical protein
MAPPHILDLAQAGLALLHNAGHCLMMLGWLFFAHGGLVLYFILPEAARLEMFSPVQGWLENFSTDARRFPIFCCCWRRAGFDIILSQTGWFSEFFTCGGLVPKIVCLYRVGFKRFSPMDSWFSKFFISGGLVFENCSPAAG